MGDLVVWPTLTSSSSSSFFLFIFTILGFFGVPFVIMAAVGYLYKRLYAGAPPQWQLIDVGRHVRAASQHGAAAIEEKMYVVGGCCTDRYLNDVLVFDLGGLRWSTAQPCPVSCAGHSVVASGKTLLLVVGIPSDEKMRVYQFDTNQWSRLKTGGDTPAATRGHSTTLIGSKIWVYGGVDFHGQLRRELHALDLGSNQWELIEARGVIPPALSFHAAVHEGNHLYLFGAGSSGFCKNLYALDLVEREWSRYPDQGPALVPAARFATAVTENQCYVVGGSTKETMLLNMESLEWTVVCAEPRLATESLSLVHARIKGRGALVASGGNPFSVFLLKTMKSYPVLPHPMGKCQVRSVDGPLLELFEIPDAGEQALKIIDRLWTKVGNGGDLVRDGRPLERDDVIFPGDELTFRPNDFVGIRGSIHHQVCEVRLMALGGCQLVLAAAKIELIRGEGWLEPREEIESQAFAGWNSRRPGDTMEYLVEGAKVPRFYRLEHVANDEGTFMEEISTTTPDEFPYTLCFKLDAMLMHMSVAEDIITGYYMKEEIGEVDIWRALVMLVGVNIRCRTLKPWMVITDLKDEWHFAWMDWPRMYVCKAWSRSQGLGILCDLCHDYNLVTSPETKGCLSNLPSIFTRACPGFKWDMDEETRVMFAPRPPVYHRCAETGRALKQYRPEELIYR
ncbi:uncharacterized protein LOC9644205 isoform X1 [Selaginella moellendorffii]|uniref:uncharacterized protein LOC9644205 isoform X1 n=1 Tax=Selaginella moellendorffii TaxID=88036 RepID=UPI000D1C25FD|nr:uncharacterized protein LOC9644205 isoform X1 [Selaginella moellendorffii]|eukprot:XP_024544600.1 uncharacterized protein LOC9644205 isoform X1 [Selaginella moellendorffii]